MPLSFYLQIYGCQMNAYEAGVVRKILTGAGYEEIKNPAKADVVLIITCAVREHAEKRALGRIGSFHVMKKEKPETVIGVLGCMAQRLGEHLISEYGVDIVLGPDEYLRLPELIAQAQNGRPSVALTLKNECYADIYPEPVNQVTATVTVMRGCNNFCSYCIVPYVRGQQRSRPLRDIVEEIKMLVDQGIKEVTLLGQNVLAYRENDVDFAALLTRVAEISGIKRVRFLTSHPRDLTEKIVTLMRNLPPVCPQLHLPLQSGSNKILQLMNRGYTREEYLEKIAMIRELIPGVSLTTDIMVGFPCEERQDFFATIDVIKTVRFDYAYMFRFSPRPGTAAASMKPTIPPAEAAVRLEKLIRTQNRITLESNRAMLNHEYEVLIETDSPRGAGCLGRTRGGKVVVLDQKLPSGTIINVRIVAIRGWTPVGETVWPAESVITIPRSKTDNRLGKNDQTKLLCQRTTPVVREVN